MFGATLCGVGMVLLPFADSLAAVVGIRLLQGVAEAAFFVAGIRAARRPGAARSRMGEALSYNSLGLYLGIALGPPLGELLIERSGLRRGLVRRHRALVARGGAGPLHSRSRRGTRTGTATGG